MLLSGRVRREAEVEVAVAVSVVIAVECLAYVIKELGARGKWHRHAVCCLGCLFSENLLDVR